MPRVTETALEQRKLRQKAQAVHETLVQSYNHPTWRQHRDPVSELVLTYLSQNTSDVNSLRAFQKLREAYPNWEEVVEAPVDQIADTIRSGGLADIKAPRIQAALERIQDERGEMSLDFLAELPLVEAQQWLTSLKGIGHKSASIVLLFCFGRPVFPVDTHVLRVSRRLGMVPAKAGAEQTKGAWEGLVDGELFYPLHLNLIRHGRTTCKARKPLCQDCGLQQLCDWHSETNQVEEP